MVDIGGKPVTRRVAVADGRICMHAETLHSIQKGSHKKGDVLGIARIAGIAGAKKTSDLVPLCHSIPLTSVQVEFAFEDTVPAGYCKATWKLGQTGAEWSADCRADRFIEIYDMCGKDRGMTCKQLLVGSWAQVWCGSVWTLTSGQEIPGLFICSI